MIDIIEIATSCDRDRILSVITSRSSLKTEKLSLLEVPSNYIRSIQRA
jgi:hypothetical protein